MPEANEPTTAPSEPEPEPVQKIEAPPTVLGFPVRYRVNDIPSEAKIVLAGHRQPQKVTLYMAWYVLKGFTDSLVAALASVPRDPEGIFVMSFGAVKVRPEEGITLEERANGRLVGADGMPVGKV